MTTTTDNIWTEALVEKRVFLSVNQMTEKMEEHLEKQIRKRFSNKCIEEGYVLASSIRIKNYSCGKITNQGIHMVVMFYCLVCHPPPGVILNCIVSDITKAGVHAMLHLAEENVDPISVYVLRDHERQHEMFEKVTKGDTIRVRLLGARFELDDPCIQAVAEFVTS
jgi:DNA-directed RNA polymerase subunit E'/Rpb7